MSSGLKSQFISSYHSSGKTDQVPDLFYRYNKDFVNVYNRIENNKLISKVTADDLSNIGHDKERLNITHVSEATFRRKPILIIVTTTNTTPPTEADKPSIQVFWHRILDQTTSIIHFDSPLVGDVSMVALTSHPLTMVKNSYQEIKEEEHLRHLLVFGKHDQTIQVALIHDAEEDGRVRGLVTKAELPAQDSGIVTAIHILTQDPLDWRLGFNDPRILLGTSNGGIQDMRFHALFREEEPDGGIHIFSPKMLSEFTKLNREPITYLTCERAPGNRKVIAAVAQRSRTSVSTQDDDDNENPSLHVIEWYGNNRRRVSERLTPSNLTSYNISSARIILTETDFRVSVIFHSTEEKDRFEVGVWDILERGAIKLLSEDLVESADNNIIQDMWPNPEISGYTLLYSDSVVELSATPVDVSATPSPQTTFTDISPSIPAASKSHTEPHSTILSLDEDDNEISVLDKSLAKPISGPGGTLTRDGLDNSTSAHTDPLSVKQILDRDSGDHETSVVGEVGGTPAHGGLEDELSDSTSTPIDSSSVKQILSKGDSENETSAMDETEGSLAHGGLEDELDDSLSTHTDPSPSKQILDGGDDDIETTVMDETEGSLAHDGLEDELDDNLSTHTDPPPSKQKLDEGDDDIETTVMDETEGSSAHGGLEDELDDSTSTHTYPSPSKQILSEDDSENETSVMDETEDSLAHGGLEDELGDSLGTHTDPSPSEQILDEGDGDNETSVMDETEDSLAHGGLEDELGDSLSTHTDPSPSKQILDEGDGDNETSVMDETEDSLAHGGLEELSNSSGTSLNTTQANRVVEDEKTGTEHRGDMEVDKGITLENGSHDVDGDNTMDNDQPSQSMIGSPELTTAQVDEFLEDEKTGIEYGGDMELDKGTLLELGSHDTDGGNTVDNDQPSQSTINSQLTPAPQKLDNRPDEPTMSSPQEETMAKEAITPHTDDEADAFSPKQSDTDNDTNSYELTVFNDDVTDYIPTIDQQGTAESIASTFVVTSDQSSSAPCQENVVNVIPNAKMIYEAKVKGAADISLSDGLAMVRNDTSTDFSPRERLWIFLDVLFAVSSTKPAMTIEQDPIPSSFLDTEKAINTVDDLSLDDVEKDWLMGYCYNNVDRPFLKLWIMRYNIKHKRYRLVMLQHQTMNSKDNRQQHNEDKTMVLEDRVKRSCDNLAKLCQKMEPEILQYLPLELYARPRGKIGNPFLNEEDPTLLKRKGLFAGIEMLQRVLDGKRQRRE